MQNLMNYLRYTGGAIYPPSWQGIVEPFLRNMGVGVLGVFVAGIQMEIKVFERKIIELPRNH